jgi:uncharacterized protein (TIGR02145 family)
MKREISIIIFFMVISSFADIITVPEGQTLDLMGTTVGPGQYEVTANGLKKINPEYSFLGAQLEYNPEDTITDADGNIYHFIKIGNQFWTVENLKTTKYTDGTPIALNKLGFEWSLCSENSKPAYCWFDNDNKNKDKYGMLYNWYAVETGKLAPKGWHVPTESEWTELEGYLIANGYNCDGIKKCNKIAKSMAARTDWSTSSVYGTIGNDLLKNNLCGFSALPGGYRNLYGNFQYQSQQGEWWSATKVEGATTAYHHKLENGKADLGSSWSGVNKGCGFSVRLVRDR